MTRKTPGIGSPARRVDLAEPLAERDLCLVVEVEVAEDEDAVRPSASRSTPANCVVPAAVGVGVEASAPTVSVSGATGNLVWLTSVVLPLRAGPTAGACQSSE